MLKKMLATLALVAVAGCGTQFNPAPTRQFSMTTMVEKKTEMWDQLVAGLGLSADQLTKANQIKDRFKLEPWMAKRDTFVALIGGDKVDRAKLETFFTGLVADVDAAVTAKQQAMVDFRDLLTPEQRTKAAQLMLDRMARGKGDGDGKRHRRGGHGMAKVTRMLAGLDMRRLWPATASFMLSGDKDALAKAFTSSKPAADRVKALTDAVAGMDQDDRECLVAHLKDKQDATPDTPATAPATP